jgi:molybdate transport repressor ModE-like protein
MDVRSLELFVAIAEEGSIHGGARRVLIAQPAASKSLRKLERQLRTELVTRSPRGVVLTRSGEMLFSEAKRVLAHFNRLSQVLKENSAQESSITVGLMSGNLAAGELTFDLVNEFRRHIPNLSVRVRELSFSEQFDAVISGDVDVAIVRPPCGTDEVSLIPLFDEPRVLCCREDNPLASKHSVSPDDLLDQIFVNVTGTRTRWAGFWQLDDLRNSPARTSEDAADTAAEMQYVLLSGEAIIPVAQSAWRMRLSDNALRAVPIEGVPPSQVALAYSSKNPRDEVWAFAECARAATQIRIDRVADAELAAID